MVEQEGIKDPFEAVEEIPENKGKKMSVASVRRAEKGSFTNQAVANPQPTQELTEIVEGMEELSLPTFETGDILPGSYQRVEDLAERAGFFKLEMLEFIDLFILSIKPALSAQYRTRNGQPSEYAIVEFDFVNAQDNPDPEQVDGPFYTTVGGTVALPKLKSAARKIINGQATGPLVAYFERKSTASGQMFWDVK